MMTRIQKRTYSVAVTLALAALTWLIFAVYSVTLQDTRFISGWFLFAVIVALALFNSRKKLPFLPLGSGTAWLRFHVYAGLYTFMLFAVHIQFRLPNGYLDLLLATLLMAVLLSGIVGLWLSWQLPQRLTTRSESVLFERIPVLIRELAWEVKRLVLQGVEEADSKMLPDFYAARLLAFFERPRHFLFHLSESDRPMKKLLNEIDGLHRYASAKEKELLQSISKKVIAKSDLDYQYAQQWLLKAWLFVHIPLTYGLLLVIALHIIVGYDYRGDLP